MKRLLTIIFSFLSIFASAQSISQGTSVAKDSYLSNPESMYVIVMVILILAFVFGIIYTLGRANRMMSKHMEDSF